jgi:hypothetical protein
MDPVTGPRDAGGERHPLRDVLLGLWATLGPMLARARAASATATRPSAVTAAPSDGELVEVCLGVLALAWRLEGVLLAAAAGAAPARPDAGQTFAGSLLR